MRPCHSSSASRGSARSGWERCSYLSFSSDPIRGAQLALEELAHGVAGQLRQHLEALGALVGVEVATRKFQQLCRRGAGAGPELAECLDLLAEFRIWNADDGCIEHRGMLEQHRLDLSRVDVDAAGDDHVLEPVGDVEIAVAVQIADIADSEEALCIELRSVQARFV